MKKLIIILLFVFASAMGWADLICGPYAPGEKMSVTIDALVGYMAKGLPSGLKLDKKTGTISGTPKKPGSYQATFTKKGAETLSTTFIVSDWPQVSVSCAGLTNQTFTVGVVRADESIPVEIEPLSAVKSVKASKLPSGMKLVKDKTTGAWSITGSPKKAGTYNVTLTVSTTCGNKQTQTLPMTVEALPSWAVGTFIGMVRQVDRDVSGNVVLDDELHNWYDVLTTMTVASSGKVSVSWRFPDFSQKMVPGTIAAVSNGCYVIEGECICAGPSEQLRMRSRYVIQPLMLSGNSVTQIGSVIVDMLELAKKTNNVWHDAWHDGMQVSFLTDDSYPLLQNVWSRKDVGALPNLKGVRKRIEYKNHMCDFSFGAMGKVAIKVLSPEGKTYSTSGILTLRGCREGMWYGEICAIVVFKKNYSSATRVFNVAIDGSDVTITPREGGQQNL